MTSADIRQSFLDFFKSKGHTIVRSSPLDYRSRDGARIFTNAGMNQFVPIFLGEQKPDVNKWADCIPGLPTRAADTQKCIRATGKHNDLEDVGLDTYHHTFFEMLGNWSFGDYFKKEAIEWAWELVVEKWKIPAKRLYATVYRPGPGEPSEFDQESYDHWARLFAAAGLDPKIHVCFGGLKDNFWMMGETGPCGPCSEIHMDLTPAGDTQGKLVNAGTGQCIEIWNLVFIQFNANADGTFSPLPARHVDTGLGFERVTGIIQCTKNFKDFTHVISNYETDIFRPIFDAIEKLSGVKYHSTLPGDELKTKNLNLETVRQDIAFRVIADHIRTLSFAIADGIQPGNKERNAVVRRILRRAAMFGRSLGFHQPFLYKLVSALAVTVGHVFPEIRAKQGHIEQIIQREEEAFNKTLDSGIEQFEEAVRGISEIGPTASVAGMRPLGPPQAGKLEVFPDGRRIETVYGSPGKISGEIAFKLHATYGLPIEEVERLARERGLKVDMVAFNALNQEHKVVSGAGQVKQVVELSQVETTTPTKFVGFDKLETQAKVLEVVSLKDETAVILDTSACYAEMGGQVGDTGELEHGSQLWRIVDTQRSGNTWLHFVEDESVAQASGLFASTTDQRSVPPAHGTNVTLNVDRDRRRAIERHHTVTHLLHWALHEVVSKEASQKGSFVGPDKLTFDFNSAPLTPAQVADIEKLVNERILENAGVSWIEVPYAAVKSRKDIRQFFGEKYGDTVRVLQIGGERGKLNGYSMELCGGTHCRATGEIGLFRIVSEAAIAAGVRRIEAIAGLEAYRKASDELELIKSIAGKVNSPVGELGKKIENILEQQKALEKQLKALVQQQAAQAAKGLAARAQTINGVPAIIENIGAADADALQGMVNELKGQFKGVIILGGVTGGAVALVASVSPEFTAKVQAGKIIQQIAPIVGGKGGGKPDNARGGGKDVSKLDEALAKAKSLLG